MNPIVRFLTATVPKAVSTFLNRFPELWIGALATLIFMLLLPIKFWWLVFVITVLLVGTFRRVRHIPAVERVLKFVERYQSYLGLILILLLGIAVCQINAPVGRDGNPYNPFLTGRNQTNVLRQVSINGVLAVGMTLVILTAGIDLSVGAVLALCAVVSADLLRYYQWPVVAVIPAVLLLGFACGLTNGTLVTKARLQPFIATLAMFSMARGFAKYWGVWHGGGNQLIGLSPQEIIGGQPVHYGNIRQFLILARSIVFDFQIRHLVVLAPILLLLVLVVVYHRTKRRMPVALTCSTGALEAVLVALLWRTPLDRLVNRLFMRLSGQSADGLVDTAAWYWQVYRPFHQAIVKLRAFGDHELFTFSGLKVQSVIFLVVVSVGIFVLTKTRFGRYIYAIGGNEEAARLSGINVHFVKNWVYGMCGLLAGVAGLVYAADLQSGDPNAGVGYELDAIAAVVIGGTSLMGGVGSMIGTLLGALIIGYINNIMALKGLGSELQFILKGIIIVLAVMLQRSKKST